MVDLLMDFTGGKQAGEGIIDLNGMFDFVVVVDEFFKESVKYILNATCLEYSVLFFGNQFFCVYLKLSKILPDFSWLI